MEGVLLLKDAASFYFYLSSACTGLVNGVTVLCQQKKYVKLEVEKKRF
jgi:hypothetical protein